ncbi:MAG: YkgJ family cysteine cluster protein [Lentisphaeria bacterium]|nr:YkgJ family cysteine cluster protein [Lentisphaeria bacterium]
MKKSSTENFQCRPHCGACCTAPSISSAIPGMPQGKPAGVSCINLDENMRCRIFNSPDRPAVCASLQPSQEMCGNCREEALKYLTALEKATAPSENRKNL